MLRPISCHTRPLISASDLALVAYLANALATLLTGMRMTVSPAISISTVLVVSILRMLLGRHLNFSMKIANEAYARVDSKIKTFVLVCHLYDDGLAFARPWLH